MKFGLKQDILDQLNDVFKKYPSIESVYIFGSRATGTYKKTSDIDLAVSFKSDSGDYSKIKWDLEELNIIYKMDLVDLNNLTNEELKRQIEITGVKI